LSIFFVSFSVGTSLICNAKIFLFLKEIKKRRGETKKKEKKDKLMFLQ